MNIKSDVIISGDVSADNLSGSNTGDQSISLTLPTGLSVSGSPITGSGTFTVSFTAGYSIPTTTKQGQWDTAYTDRNKWDGGATGLTASTGRTSLGLGTIATQSAASVAITGGTITGLTSITIDSLYLSGNTVEASAVDLNLNGSNIKALASVDIINSNNLKIGGTEVISSTRAISGTTGTFSNIVQSSANSIVTRLSTAPTRFFDTFNSSMASGAGAAMIFGKAAVANESATIRYVHNTITASRYIGFGYFSNDDLIKFYQNGNATFSGSITASAISGTTGTFTGDVFVEGSDITVEGLGTASAEKARLRFNLEATGGEFNTTRIAAEKRGAAGDQAASLHFYTTNAGAEVEALELATGGNATFTGSLTAGAISGTTGTFSGDIKTSTSSTDKVIQAYYGSGTSFLGANSSGGYVGISNSGGTNNSFLQGYGDTYLNYLAGVVYIGKATGGSTHKLDVQGAGLFSDRVNASYFGVTGASSNRSKIRLWNQTSPEYAIGMGTTYTFGGLSNYAMTFQMDSTDTRGWWFGDTLHNNAQGAMSLTTTGLLTVAGSMRLGYGQSDTTTPGITYMFDINGTGIGADWISTSDSRLKKDWNYNIDYWSSIEAIAKSGGEFTWKESGKKDFGVKAQDLLSTSSFLVTGSEETSYGVSYSKISVINSKAIMDLKAEITELKAEILKLKG